LSETKFQTLCVAGMFLCGIALCIIGLVIRKNISEAEQPEPARPVIIEYPASEYRLQLRIVEFEGQRDTTYVLVKKINEL